MQRQAFISIATLNEWKGLPGWLSGEESTCSAGASGDKGSIPGSGRSPGGGHGNPFQYFCLENPLDRWAWQAIVHRVAKSRTQLKWPSTHAWMKYGRWVKRTPEWKSGGQTSALSPITWTPSNKSLWSWIVLSCQTEVIWLISTQS